MPGKCKYCGVVMIRSTQHPSQCTGGKKDRCRPGMDNKFIAVGGDAGSGNAWCCNCAKDKHAWHDYDRFACRHCVKRDGVRPKKKIPQAPQQQKNRSTASLPIVGNRLHENQDMFTAFAPPMQAAVLSMPDQQQPILRGCSVYPQSLDVRDGGLLVKPNASSAGPSRRLTDSQTKGWFEAAAKPESEGELRGLPVERSATGCQCLVS